MPVSASLAVAAAFVPIYAAIGGLWVSFRLPGEGLSKWPLGSYSGCQVAVGEFPSDENRLLEFGIAVFPPCWVIQSERHPFPVKCEMEGSE